MTIRDVARHLNVGWDLIKEIQKRDLLRRYAKPKSCHFRNNCGVAMSREHAYSRGVRLESRTYLANGLASWLAPRLLINRRFPLTSSSSVEVLSAAERSHVPNTKGRDWLS
jgi:hypothetical protein